MPRKRKTLPKDFSTQLKEAPLDRLIAVFDAVELNATGGLRKLPALFFPECPPALAAWLVAQGADVDARDSQGRTPLHHWVTAWSSHPEALLDLGADIGATDKAQKTPLHLAAGRQLVPSVALLLDRGADPRARDSRGTEPLETALVHTSNSTLARSAKVAHHLLEAGVPATQQHRAMVHRLGEAFESARDVFNPDFLEETEAALYELYTLFGVTPVPPLQRHDGVSPIQVPEGTWGAQHRALWDLLVPASGTANTVQGEIIRTSGKMADEIFRNGGANWDRGFSSMLLWTITQLGEGNPLPAPQLEEAAGLREAMRGGHCLSGSAPAPERLQALAVHWVRLNRTPLPNSAPRFGR